MYKDELTKVDRGKERLLQEVKTLSKKHRRNTIVVSILAVILVLVLFVMLYTGTTSPDKMIVAVLLFSFMYVIGKKSLNTEK
jgi:heme/copper-type cytochrome/quinol oxidase subunit 4